MSSVSASPQTPRPDDLPESCTDAELLSSPIDLAFELTAGRYLIPAHLDLLSEALATAAMTPGARLMVTMPPRHGKSELVSHWFPVWFLATFPHKRVILASYEADFAAMWGRKVRNEIKEHESVLGVSIREDSTAANRWETSAGGGMVTAGAGGPITGRGADLLIVDDPIKNDEEANSAVMREKVWGWWQSTAYTRLEPGAAAVLVQTRWHEDDLAGRLLKDAKAGGETWNCIDFPAVAEDHDVLGRSPGDPLWPDRYGREDLRKIERSVGSRSWTSLYQQRPSPASGGLFKREWFKYYDTAEEHYGLYSGEKVVRRVPKADCWRFVTCDLAITTKTYSDFSVIQVWDVERRRNDAGEEVGGAMFLVDQWRERVEAPVIERQLKTTLARWQPQFIGIEDNSNYDTSLIQRFKDDRLPVLPMQPDKDKVTRATTASVWMEAGNIYLPLFSPWLGDLEHELLVFPHGEHDDQVDALAYAAIYANRRDRWLKPKPPELPPGSIGKLLGMDKVFAPKPRNPSPFAMNRR